MQPTETEAANVRRALKARRAQPVAWQMVTAGGHTPAHRWVVRLDDGGSAFVKAATDELTASWLRDEHLAYSLLRGSSFMPAYVGFFDDGERPVLALEDLSPAAWPPPWDAERIEAVLGCLRLVAAADPPADLPLAADDHLQLRDGWAELEREAGAFLALGLCSQAWFDANLPTLRSAGEAAPLAGEALLHFDVRSDNLCVRPEGSATLVDWNWTSVGNPEIDIAFWLPSLEAEGGPAPETVLPAASPELVACWAGFLCSHAARPPIETAPNVRSAQLRQARSALPWATRALGLPPLA